MNATHEMFYQAFGKTFGPTDAWPEVQRLIDEKFTFDVKTGSYSGRQLCARIEAVETYGSIRDAGIWLSVSAQRLWGYQLARIGYDDCGWYALVKKADGSLDRLTGTFALR